MKPIIYGIKNCDTVKKTLQWFNNHSIEYTFHDYKKDGLKKETFLAWHAQCGLERLINKKGTSYRSLTEPQKILLEQLQGALPLLLEKPTILKRPVVEVEGKVFAVGFEESKFELLAGI